MDIYQLAIDMELEGKAYYLRLAQESLDAQLKRVFEILAEEEEGHCQLLQALKDKVAVPLINDQLFDAETIFRVRLLEHVDLRQVNTVLEAYGQAVVMEQNAIDYYKKMSRIADNAAEKAVFLRMHYEEKKHRFLLENIMELLRDRHEDALSAETAQSVQPENL
jgi:rubrerythrin